MEQQQERRKTRRRRILKAGVLAYNNRFASINCTIRNESESGALLFVEYGHIIPTHCELRQLPEKNYRPIEIIWRTPNAMGVRYLDVEIKDEANLIWNDVERRSQEERRRGERRQGDRRQEGRRQADDLLNETKS